MTAYAALQLPCNQQNICCGCAIHVNVQFIAQLQLLDLWVVDRPPTQLLVQFYQQQVVDVCTRPCAAGCRCAQCGGCRVPLVWRRAAWSRTLHIHQQCSAQRTGALRVLVTKGRCSWGTGPGSQWQQEEAAVGALAVFAPTRSSPIKWRAASTCSSRQRCSGSVHTRAK